LVCAWVFAVFQSPEAAAAGTAGFELGLPPASVHDTLTPEMEDRLINELYSHYVECLETRGNEEACYRSWRRECRNLFQSRCSLLEEQMFPTAPEGDESC
jgi:hypothetical protein